MTGPAATSSLEAPPDTAITVVDRAMKPMMNRFSFRAMKGWSVLRNETEV